MTREYMNASARNRHLQILALFGMLDALLEGKDAESYTTKEQKYLRTAKTYILKANDLVIKRLDTDFANRLMRELKDLIVYTETRSKDRITRGKELKEEITLTMDNFYDICDLAGIACRNCTKEPEGCKVYELFIENTVPVANESVDTGDCPYRH